MTNTANQFFDELETLLRKYFGDDWVWRYKDGYHPLEIISDSLAKAWEEYMEEEDL